MLKQKYFLTDFFILSAEKQPIKSSWRKIEWLQEIPGISLGTTSYLPESGEIQYRNIKNGSIVKGKYNDFSKTKANQISLLCEYNFDNDISFTFNGKYMYADASYYVLSGNRISDVDNGIELNADPSVAGISYYDNGKLYTGKKQGRIGYSHEGNVENILFTSEIKKKSESHFWRIGLNQWRYNVKYSSETTQFDQTVNAYPRILTRKYTDDNGNLVSDRFYRYNAGGSEFYEGYENKLAVYFTDEWTPNDKWNFYYGARGEYYKLFKFRKYSNNVIKKAKEFDNSMIITILMSPNKRYSTL